MPSNKNRSSTLYLWAKFIIGLQKNSVSSVYEHKSKTSHDPFGLKHKTIDSNIRLWNSVVFALYCLWPSEHSVLYNLVFFMFQNYVKNSITIEILSNSIFWLIFQKKNLIKWSLHTIKTHYSEKMWIACIKTDLIRIRSLFSTWIFFDQKHRFQKSIAKWQFEIE